MTTVIRRSRPIAALLVVFGLGLAACSSGPSQVNAAAIVSGKAIGVDQVQELVERAVKAEPAAESLATQRKLDLLSRGVLRQLVMHELIAGYAAKNNLTVEQDKVTKLAADLGESLKPLPTDGSVPPEAIVDQAVNKTFDRTELARDYLLLAQIGGAEAASLAVTFDYVIVAPGVGEQTGGSVREQAIAKARDIAQAPDGGTKIIDDEVAAGGQAGKGETLTPAKASDIAGSLLFGAPENTAVAFQPSKESGGWVVAVIRKRDHVNTGDKPQPQVATVLAPRLLQPMVQELGLRVSPRYGVWDTAAMAIAPSERETAGESFPLKASADNR